MRSEAGYNIFAHSRPDKIGTPRLLPHYYFENFAVGISAKKSAQIPYPVSCFMDYLEVNIICLK